MVLAVAGYRTFCYQVASSLGLPVPVHTVVSLSRFAEARRFMRGSRGPWVAKPARDSSAGLGITTGIQSEPQLAGAVALASLFSHEVVLEEMTLGESCRLLFLDGRLLGAVRRGGLRVRGDGRATVRELAASRFGRRRVEHPLARATVGRQSLSLDDVVPAGREVVVLGQPNTATVELRTVYDEDITDLVGTELVEQLAAVACALGSRLAGIDILTLDPTLPLQRSGGVFLEINTTPGIHHHYLAAGSAPPVAVPILRALLGIAASV